MNQLSHAIGGLSVSESWDGPERELVPGSLRGYRAWALDMKGGLHACNWPSFVWQPGRNEANCQDSYRRPGCGCDLCSAQRMGGLHVAPMQPCQCGFYARHRPGQYDTRGEIGGVIKAYGKVILAETGFRAQYAEIEALFMHSQIAAWPGGMYWPGDLHWAGTAAMLNEKYQVPVFESEEAMLEDFPPISVDQLMPEPEPITVKHPEDFPPYITQMPPVTITFDSKTTDPVLWQQFLDWLDTKLDPKDSL